MTRQTGQGKVWLDITPVNWVMAPDDSSFLHSEESHMYESTKTWISLGLSCSSSLMATPLPRAQTTLPVGCLTCVLTRSWWFTHMTTSSAVSPLSHSPRVAAYCWLATTISTATSGTLWRPTVQVSQRTGQLCEHDRASLTDEPKWTPKFTFYLYLKYWHYEASKETESVQSGNTKCLATNQK